MVDVLNLILVNGIIKHPSVAAAMKAIDRGFYSRHNPYQDSPQSIGYAVTISAPHMVKTTISSIKIYFQLYLKSFSNDSFGVHMIKSPFSNKH